MMIARLRLERCGPSTRDAVRAPANLRRALDQLDLVLAEEEVDAAGVLADHLVLARHHRREVEPDRADLDAVRGQRVPRLVEFLRGLQQRLRRDAADIEAGAAEASSRLSMQATLMPSCAARIAAT